jgi:HSP20 family protein
MKSLIPWKSKQSSAIPALWEEDWFESFWENPFRSLLSPFSQEYNIPAADVSEDKKEVVVRAEIPGVDAKDIELTYQEGVLRISGEKKENKEEKGRNRYYRECRYGYFSKGIPLGERLDWAKAKAEYKNGILTVKIPKSEKENKAIEVKID